MNESASSRGSTKLVGPLEQPPGLDLGRLGAWFAGTVPGASAHLSARLLAGGKSNLTYEVYDGTSSWVVRRPPLGHVLSTAHDMAREFRVMSALHGGPVPVPRTYGLCTDESVLGAPFYVMERIVGRPYRDASELSPLGERRTRSISTALVETLAALHTIEPGHVGLGDFGRPHGYLGRQVSRWKRQLDASRSRELPLAEALHSRLATMAPRESATGIVHGDYRLDNLLVDENDRVAAVIDWEMATLGDPLIDLAILIVYGRLAEAAPGTALGDAASAPGFLTEAEIVKHYSAISGHDLSRFGFYLGLASFKLAAILEGIHYRYLQGQTVGDGFDRVGEAVQPLLESGLTALSEVS
jgi:aminoglycoside phosphotransferase (APT) family kinase protein